MTCSDAAGVAPRAHTALLQCARWATPSAFVRQRLQAGNCSLSLRFSPFGDLPCGVLLFALSPLLSVRRPKAGVLGSLSLRFSPFGDLPCGLLILAAAGVAPRAHTALLQCARWATPSAFVRQRLQAGNCSLSLRFSPFGDLPCGVLSVRSISLRDIERGVT